MHTINRIRVYRCTRYLIVGLGNPGPKHTNSRHNVGFVCPRRLAAAYHLEFGWRQKQALIAWGSICRQCVVLALPQTFMNESGRSVGPLVRSCRMPLEHLLVVYDDLDPTRGTLRLRLKGSGGGHKGMRSIVKHLGSQTFPRLRIGIGRPTGQMDSGNYALQDFPSEEGPLIKVTLERAVGAIETSLAETIREAMRRYKDLRSSRKLSVPGLWYADLQLSGRA